jgi:hypothetical protein
VDREEVGTVRLHLHVEHRPIELELRLQIVTDPPARLVDHEDPRVIGAEAELARRAEHPVRLDASQASHPERLVEHGHARAGRCPRDEVPGDHVPDADDELRLTCAVLDPRDAELVGVGVIPHLEHAHREDALEPRPRIEETLHLHPAMGHQVGELVGRHVGRHELPEPTRGHPHAVAPHCSRKRMSPSTSMRMSGIA